MEWLRRMLGHSQAPAGPEPTPEVQAARVRLRRELTRADKAIQRAMDHADEVFGPTRYKGPERRARPR